MEKSEPLRERTLVISEGRITIPQKIRNKLGIKEGSVVEVYVVKDKIIVEVLTR